MRSRYRTGTLFLLAALLMWILTGCAPSQEVSEGNGTLFAMNTYMTFTVYGDRAQPAIDAVQEQIRHLESLWSVTAPESDIYRANHSGGRATVVSEETARLVAYALEMAQTTDGDATPFRPLCL